MPPITFRNINTPNFASANDLLQSGANTLQRNIDNLSKLAKKVDDESIAEDVNTFKDRLSSSNLDDVGNVSTEGLDRISASQAENLRNTRINNLRNSATSAFNFNETQRKQAEQPLIAKANELAHAGDVKGLKQFITSGEGKNIQDTSKLSQIALNQSRANTQYARTEDAFQDQQALNKAVRGLQSSRQQEVADRKQAFADYEISPNIGIAFDKLKGTNPFTVAENGSSITFNDKVPLTDAEKQVITDDFEQYKQSLGELTTDTEQRNQLTDLVRNINATPQQEKAALGLLKSNQDAQRALTDESKAAYAESEREADILHKTQIERENNEFAQFIAELPVNPKRTAEQEKIKLGDVLTKIRKDLPKVNPNDIDNSDVVEVTEALTSAVKRGYGQDNIEYPGWVIDEAYKNIGAIGLVNDEWYQLRETAKTDTFQEELDRVMEQHLQSEDNLSKQTARRDLHNERMAGFGIQNLKNKAKALNAVRNSQGQIKIGN